MAEPRKNNDVLLHASGRTTTGEAVLWFSEGHPMLDGTAPQRVIGALLTLPEDTPSLEDALRSVVRQAATSTFDPSSVLFKVDTIQRPDAVRRCLDALALRSPSEGLTGLTASSVAAALRDEPECMDVLAFVAGLTPKELRRRMGEDAPKGQAWSQRQVQAALRLITSIVEGTSVSLVTGAEPARPVEMIFKDEGSDTGWDQVETMRTQGVPYELLLTQRAVGAAWQNHRNSTSSEPGTALATELCARLDVLGTTYLRSRSKGGTDDLTQISSIGKFAAVMTRPAAEQEPWSECAFMVVFVGIWRPFLYRPGHRMTGTVKRACVGGD